MINKLVLIGAPLDINDGNPDCWRIEVGQQWRGYGEVTDIHAVPMGSPTEEFIISFKEHDDVFIIVSAIEHYTRK